MQDTYGELKLKKCGCAFLRGGIKMNQIYEFMTGALPWIAMGLLLAIAISIFSAIKEKGGK